MSREGTTKILISTDVLSRGFDVTQARAGREGGEGTHGRMQLASEAGGDVGKPGRAARQRGAGSLHPVACIHRRRPEIPSPPP